MERIVILARQVFSRLPKRTFYFGISSLGSFLGYCHTRCTQLWRPQCTRLHMRHIVGSGIYGFRPTLPWDHIHVHRRQSRRYNVLALISVDIEMEVTVSLQLANWHGPATSIILVLRAIDFLIMGMVTQFVFPMEHLRQKRMRGLPLSRAEIRLIRRLRRSTRPKLIINIRQIHY